MTSSLVPTKADDFNTRAHGFVQLVEEDSNTFVNKVSQSGINYAKLLEDFKYVITDFEEIKDKTKGYFFINFASRVIYEVGPEARKVKKGTIKTWNYSIPVKSGNENVLNFISISTYKGDGEVYEPSKDKRLLKLTTKMAGILAIECMFNITCAYPTTIMLTPLSSAIITRDSVARVVDELKVKANTICNIINSSVQSGGQYLRYSTHSCAKAAILSGTRNMKDIKTKEMIIRKMDKQYDNIHKLMNVEEFKFWCYHMIGTETGASLDECMKMAEEGRNKIYKIEEVGKSIINAHLNY